MPDSFFRIPPDGAGKSIDTEAVTTGAGLVQRQRVVSFDENAENRYGEAATVTPGATVTLVSFAAPAGWRFAGFIGGGESDGNFHVEFDGVVAYRDRTNIAKRRAEVLLPTPDPAAGDTLVTIKVTNNGDVSAAFEAMLLGV